MELSEGKPTQGSVMLTFATTKQKAKQMQKDKITPENLHLKIKDATHELLEMAREFSWNRISSNVRYVTKKVNLETIERKNNFEINRIRKMILSSQERLSLESAILQLNAEFDNIYLIELYVFKATRRETIVEIEILEKSELRAKYENIAVDECPTLHGKVPIPLYIGYKNKDKYKFDINWQLETFEYKWKMFWFGMKNQ